MQLSEDIKHINAADGAEGFSKKVFIETFGCQMNESDTERMLGFLGEVSYKRTARPEDADLVIINTCSIRDKAEQKVYSTLGRFRSIKEANPGLIIGVSGCVAEQAGEKLFKRAPYLDMVIGTENIHRIGGLIEEVRSRRRVSATGFSGIMDETGYSRRTGGGVKAFVSIMRGCNNYCSYCIVPYTRGPEVSRSAEGVLREVRMLARGGTKEVTLIGQNVNSYRDPAGMGFPGLLKAVCAIGGIERVRFVTSHPRDLSKELMELFGGEKKLCRALHLPVQSGSDAVLKKMRRGYTRAEYIEKVERLKGLYPDMAITTDIIVGFPGETEDDFNGTMELLSSVRYDNIFSFMYSPRPGTVAAGLDGEVPLRVRRERLKLVQETQRAISLEKSGGLVGRTVTVLVEGPSKQDPDEFTGRTPCNRVVNFPAPTVSQTPDGLAGCLIDVSITAAFQNSLRGVFKERSEPCSWK